MLNTEKAFTLAEVLITLGIIGVVAALTLPSLISRYKKQVIATRLKQFASIWQQAIRMAEIENGETTTWDGFTPLNADAMLESYNKYLGKYITTVEVHKTAYLTFCVHYESCKNLEENGYLSYDGKEKFHFSEIGTPIITSQEATHPDD